MPLGRRRGAVAARWLLWGIGLCACLAPAAGADQVPARLRVGGPGQLPPFAYLDAAGEYTGFSVDILRAVGSQLGIENLLFYPTTSAEGLRDLAAGDIDCLQCVRDQSAPSDAYTFVGFYLETPSIIFTTRDRYDVSRLPDLAGKRIGVLAEDPAYERLLQVRGAQVIVAASLDRALAALQNGGLDAYVGERLTTLHFLGQHRESVRVKTVGRPVAWSRFGLLVRKDQPVLARQLRQALAAVNRRGERDRLFTQWFGSDVQPQTPLSQRVVRWVFVFVGGSLLLAMIVLGWNLLLQRELELRAVAVENAKLDQTIAAEKSRFEAIVQSMTEGLMLVDPGGRIAYVNAQGAQFLGRRVEDLLERPLTAFKAHLFSLVKDRERLERRFDLAEASPNRAQVIEYHILTTRRQDIRLKFFPVRDQQGQFAGRGILIEDLSHEREVERLKSEFVSVASHELRTPMTSILGFSELMLTQSLPPEVVQRYTEQIHHEAERLTRILNDMLDLTYLESGEGILERQPVVLDELVREVAEAFRAQLKGRRELKVIGPEAAIRLTGDRDKLSQVFWNLLSNADKYSPPGREVEVALAVRAAPGPEWALSAEEAEWVLPAAEVRVTDFGQGIPADQLSLIFLPFHRVETAVHTIRGTGLGLAIVKRIVEGHGGRVWAASQPGQRTEFIVLLPLHSQDMRAEGPA